TFVVRRLRTTFTTKDPAELKDLARKAADTFFRAAFPSKPTKAKPADPEPAAGYSPVDPTRDAAEDLTSLYRLQGDDVAAHAEFEARNADLIRRVGMKQELQGWVVDDAGRGSWTTLPTQHGGDPVPVDGEQELPMWRLPATAAGCAPARDRSLWF